MSGAGTAEFMAYWADEGESYVRRGDYQWMASLVPGKRVVEIGCGLGFATEALLARELVVLSIDSLEACLDVTRQRVGEGRAILMQAEVGALSAEALAALTAFAPDTVVCWLMGAPADITGATPAAGGQAVVAYREKIHRAVAELAGSLPGVQFLHFIDRTAIPWQAKDIGRDTLVGYHNSKTLLDLPFSGERRNALFRKLGDKVIDMAKTGKPHPALKNVVPTLASLLAERKN